ncbi:hypothetical protein AB0425_11050 [Actinosynnema sp. NPDC051121]
MVDLAPHGIRFKAHTTRPQPHFEVRWVMSSSGVIDAPAQPPDP